MLLLLSSIAFPATFNVAVVDNEFQPKNLTIAPGDTVIWTNQGGDHSVTADDNTFDSAAEGEATIPSGESFSHTFAGAGRFPYYCLLHGGPGGQEMSGVIRVVIPGSNNAPNTPTNTSPPGGATGQSLSPTLTASAFADQDSGDIHLSSQWVIRNVGTNTVVLDTGDDAARKTTLSLTGLANNTVYGWKVRYRDDLGAWSEYSTETQFTTVALPDVQGAGLSASYGKYNRRTDTHQIIFTATDPVVSFDWKGGRPNRATPANNFFVRWEGTVLPEFSEPYRFRVRADGGVRLWVNDELIIDDWVVTPFAIFRNNVVELEAGVAVSIKLEYFDTLGNASVLLRWSSPSQPTEVIPQDRLFPALP